MREILVLLNEWWESKAISSEKAKGYRRKVFASVKETFFNYRQILILNGLRRVGKSTVIYQLIEELLKEGISPGNIMYFSFDEAVEDPLKILEEYSKITKTDWRKAKCFIFFDEIQKLRNWSSKIKILYDNFPNLKICVSGSASPAIEKEAIEDLAGRYFPVKMAPLDLQEFSELYFNKRMDNFELHESEAKRVVDDYARRPFPEIVRWEDRAKVNQYIKELVIEKMVKSDIPQTFEGINASLLSTLVEIFMKDVGMILDLTSLSRELGVHKLTLSRHMRFLEFGNLITVVKNFRPSIRAESRKLKKVYPAHIALSFCFYPKLGEGKVMESLVCSSLGLDKYWRKGGKEIDFLKVDGETMGGIIPIEVKEKEKADRNDTRTMVYFMKKYNVERGFLIYSGDERVMKIRGKTIVFFPLHKLLFNFSLQNSLGEGDRIAGE